MGIQPMVFCALLGCLISLLVIPLMLLPGLMGSIRACRGAKGSTAEVVDDRGTGNLGGIALATSFLGVATLIYFLYPATWTSAGHANVALIWTALAIFLLGLWDDYRPVGLGWKLTLQVLIAVVAYWQGVQVEHFTGPTDAANLNLGGWSGAVTVLWLVGLTNLIDFTRRIEGLTAVLGLVLLACRAVTGFGSGAEFSALFSIGLAGAMMGLLVYNLPPARVRLGGGGAGFVGFLVAGLTTINSSHDSTLSASAFLAALILPILGIIWMDARLGGRVPPVKPLTPGPARQSLESASEVEPRVRSW